MNAIKIDIDVTLRLSEPLQRIAEGWIRPQSAAPAVPEATEEVKEQQADAPSEAPVEEAKAEPAAPSAPKHQELTELVVISSVGIRMLSEITSCSKDIMGGKFYDTWDCTEGCVGNFWTK